MLRNYTTYAHSGGSTQNPTKRSGIRTFNNMYLRAHYIYAVPFAIGTAVGGVPMGLAAVAAVPEVISVPFIAGGMR